jgi:hypothetical protein
MKKIDIINRKLSLQFRKIELKNTNYFYVNINNIVKLCSKYNNNFYFSIFSNKKINKKQCKNISPVLTIEEINNILKYYEKYFKFDIVDNKYQLNPTIFKIFFLNYKNRKYINKFNVLKNKKFINEVDAKGELLLFLLKTNFISIKDLNI